MDINLKATLGPLRIAKFNNKDTRIDPLRKQRFSRGLTIELVEMPSPEKSNMFFTYDHIFGRIRQLKLKSNSDMGPTINFLFSNDEKIAKVTLDTALYGQNYRIRAEMNLSNSRSALSIRNISIYEISDFGNRWNSEKEEKLICNVPIITFGDMANKNSSSTQNMTMDEKAEIADKLIDILSVNAFVVDGAFSTIKQEAKICPGFNHPERN